MIINAPIPMNVFLSKALFLSIVFSSILFFLTLIGDLPMHSEGILCAGVIPPKLIGVGSRKLVKVTSFGGLSQLHGWGDAADAHIRAFVIVSP